ncbi:hypothetical protein Acsp03_28290 [Actinomadura sp. NBRC 104412]|nr:hypothetical protein Acsp03_28290 [Actinomadura sp. NBRC 104412]
MSDAEGQGACSAGRGQVVADGGQFPVGHVGEYRRDRVGGGRRGGRLARLGRLGSGLLVGRRWCGGLGEEGVQCGGEIGTVQEVLGEVGAEMSEKKTDPETVAKNWLTKNGLISG